jgi:DNA-binding response OmpR family regulator
MSDKLAFIIEDDPQLSIIFSEAIKTAGFHIKPITDGNTAIAELGNASPSLIVLDLHLPGVDGEGILQYIKGQPHLAGARIILATADARKAEELREIADIVFVKPIRFSQLRDMAERLRPE